MCKLSNRQQAILDFIRNEVRIKGYPPSVREIGDAVGLASSSTVHGHLDRLGKKGFIRRDPTKPRAIELLHPEQSERRGEFPNNVVRVPVLGKVSAGEPIMTAENIEDYFSVPAQMVRDDEKAFILAILGDSMVEAGIHHGDYVIVRQQQTANNGDIVVAMTEEDEATVKTFYREKDHIRLQPENKKYTPICLNHITILGKVIGLFRVFQ